MNNIYRYANNTDLNPTLYSQEYLSLLCLSLLFPKFIWKSHMQTVWYIEIFLGYWLLGGINYL